MYRIEFTNQMKRNVKLMRKRGKDISKLTAVLALLSKGEPLPAVYKDHRLTGELKDLRECHIEPDWLLVYKLYEEVLVITATGTGTHADLFGE